MLQEHGQRVVALFTEEELVDMADTLRSELNDLFMAVFSDVKANITLSNIVTKAICDFANKKILIGDIPAGDYYVVDVKDSTRNSMDYVKPSLMTTRDEHGIGFNTYNAIKNETNLPILVANTVKIYSHNGIEGNSTFVDYNNLGNALPSNTCARNQFIKIHYSGDTETTPHVVRRSDSLLDKFITCANNNYIDNLRVKLWDIKDSYISISNKHVSYEETNNLLKNKLNVRKKARTLVDTKYDVTNFFDVTAQLSYDIGLTITENDIANIAAGATSIRQLLIDRVEEVVVSAFVCVVFTCTDMVIANPACKYTDSKLLFTNGEFDVMKEVAPYLYGYRRDVETDRYLMNTLSYRDIQGFNSKYPDSTRQMSNVLTVGIQDTL